MKRRGFISGEACFWLVVCAVVALVVFLAANSSVRERKQQDQLQQDDPKAYYQFRVLFQHNGYDIVSFTSGGTVHVLLIAIEKAWDASPFTYDEDGNVIRKPVEPEQE